MKKKFASYLALAMAAGLLFSGCGSINPDAKLINIVTEEGTDSISLGYGNFVAKYIQAVYDQYYGSYLSDNMWYEDLYGSGNTMEEDVKAEVIDQLKEEYACKYYAGEYDVTLTQEETDKIDAAVKEFMEENTQTALTSTGATEEYVRDMLTYSYYQRAVEEAVRAKAEDEVEVSDDEVKESTISYVLFSTDDVTTDDGDIVALTEEDKEQLKKNAEALSKTSGEDFTTEAEAAEQTVLTYSYVTASDAAEDDVLGEQVIAAAQALTEEGQVSGVIEVEEEGYYVLRMDSLYDETATENKRANVLDEKIDAYYDDLIEEWEGQLSMTVNESQWKKVQVEVRYIAVPEQGTDE